MSEFDEYIVHGEPGQKEKADAWQTAKVQQKITQRAIFALRIAF